MILSIYFPKIQHTYEFMCLRISWVSRTYSNKVWICHHVDIYPYHKTTHDRQHKIISPVNMKSISVHLIYVLTALSI